MTRGDQLAAARARQDEILDPAVVLKAARAEIDGWQLGAKARWPARSAARRFLTTVAATTAQDAPDGGVGSVQDWWAGMERQLLRAHDADPGRSQATAVRALVTSRMVRPSRTLLSTVQVDPWVRALPAEDPLVVARARVYDTLNGLTWTTPKGRRAGVCAGMRLLLAHGYDHLDQIRDADLAALPLRAPGIDMLDAALCELGVFSRSAQRGSARRSAAGPRTVEQLVTSSVVEPFRPVTIAYLEAYQQRVSSKYVTTRSKVRSLAYFWEYLTTVHPGVRECRDVLPHHARGFVPWALVKARTLQRGVDRKGSEDRTTTYDWFVDVRAFFTDLCHWATEPGSPLAGHAPLAIPLTSHDLRSGGFAAARARTTARMTATVMDLTREIPNIRAYACAAGTKPARLPSKSWRTAERSELNGTRSGTGRCSSCFLLPGCASRKRPS